MKRAISSIILGGATICAFAQGSFTIVRPFDGSKVREMVKVLFPKNSVPETTGYVGIFIDGKFLEAVLPKVSADKKYYEYALDTKALEDGSHKLEAKLYVDYSNQPRIVDTSSVDITVANHSSITVPEDGVALKYRFNVGQERIYRLQQRIIQNVISEAQQNIKGSRPFEIQEEGETLKLLYACDNKYSNGDGLIRMQVVPDRGIKGREYSYLTVQDAGDTPKKYFPADMAPIYMRIQPSGREVFGAIPDYFGLDGNTGSTARFGLYASFPLPTLPSQAKKPGDTWETNFQLGAFDLNNVHTVKTVVEVVKARGDFLNVEWEMGHPCAKIKNTIAVGTGSKKFNDGLPKSGNDATGGEKIQDRKVSMEETIWFALDTGVIVKYFRDITVEGKSNFGFTSGGGGPAGAPGGGPSAAGQSGGGGGSRGKGGGGATDPGDFRISDRQGRGGSPTAAGTSSGASNGQLGRGGPQAGGGQQGGQTAFVRTRYQYLFILEK